MSLGKQAKTLTKSQVEAVLGYLKSTRYPPRNRVIFLLSVKAGLRAKEIAFLTWKMITDADGRIGGSIHLEDKASKGRSGRIIPLNRDLKTALQEWMDASALSHPSPFVCSTERATYTAPQSVVNMFARWYERVGLDSCSSHSGRRTFITNTARNISKVGGSLRDIQILAGHTTLKTTQTYIDCDSQAQSRVVNLI